MDRRPRSRPHKTRPGTPLVLEVLAVAIFLGQAACAGGVELRAASAAGFNAVHGVAVNDDRLRAPYGIEAHRVNGPIAYIVPVGAGVVLIDTGFEAAGTILDAALAGRPLLAVLLTHAHLDHVAGIERLGVLPIYAGRDDADLLSGARGYAMPWLAAADALIGPPAVPQLLPVDDGVSLELGNASFEALHLPGHTPGSTAWRFRDLLFTGDAVVSFDGDALDVAAFFFSEHYGRSVQSLARLERCDFSTICDGHFGCTPRAKVKLWAARDRYRRVARPIN